MNPAPDPASNACETPLAGWADAIEDRFPSRVGRVEVYAETTSTQDAARRRVAADPGRADGLVVTAGHQSAGRGRLGRRWESPGSRGLALSVVYTAGANTADRLAFAASVAVAETLDAWLARTGRRAHIKWPNDVVVGGRKIAGVLVEQVAGSAIVGVGINVSTRAVDLPPELRDTATGLAREDTPACRLAVMLALLTRMDHALSDRPLEDLLDAWRQRSTLRSRPVRFSSGGNLVTGQVVDLDPHAGLIVRRGSGELVHLPADSTSVLGDGPA